MNFSTLKKLVRKTCYSLKNEGLVICIKRIVKYLRKTKIEVFVSDDYYEAESTCADVLFVSGCLLPHPTRYRVSHQREQLKASGIISLEVYCEYLTLNMVKNFRVFIFFRCMNTPLITEFVQLAKENNKKVYFDIDDLIIDVKYTKSVEYLKTLEDHEKKAYDHHVKEIQNLLKQCHGAITTTERLAKELTNYVPQVIINRNVASEEMVRLSLFAMYDRDKLPYVDHRSIRTKIERENYTRAKQEADNRQGKLRIGYFSGSITHNEDFEMILSALVRLLEEMPNLELVIMGELTVPNSLKKFGRRIIAKGFTDWRKLPRIIASVDINLAPLRQTVFNEAKSENKWMEAALVGVATVASNVGAFKDAIKHNDTGVLCDNDEYSWYKAIKALLIDSKMRGAIGTNAHSFVLKKYTTINTSGKLANFLRENTSKNIAFVLPTLQISGGVLVALKHCLTLKKAGYDAFVICEDYVSKNTTYDNSEIFAISRLTTGIHMTIDVSVATFWGTMQFCIMYPNVKQRLYLVQSYETNFYDYGDDRRLNANSTYSSVHSDIYGVKFITVSKWCQRWLSSDYGIDAQYIPNGIDLNKFNSVERDFSSKKIRILVEGNSDDKIKNIDESFEIIKQLDSSKYEIWYMSYSGEPKKWYKVDRFFHKVPYEAVPFIYQQCHILLKSSILESFSYPPLEMMATGGYVIARPNEGNTEYLKDGENCLYYTSVDQAVKNILEITHNAALREMLHLNSLITSAAHDWQAIDSNIKNVYSEFI